MSVSSTTTNSGGMPPTAPALERFTSVPSIVPEGRTFEVVLNGLTFACRFDAHSGARALVVNLRGRRRKGGGLSELDGRKFARKAKVHVLSIRDPSMILNRRLRSGIFLGTEDLDPIEGVITITQAVGDQLQLEKQRCVFWGRSGRGFAALMAASRMGTGAIVAAAQTDLWPIRFVKIARRILNQFRPGVSAEELGREYPGRTNVLTAYSEALVAGRRPRLALVYNQFDHHHYREHLQPFCRAFGAPIGELSGDGLIHAELVNHNRGHAVDKATIKRMISLISHATGDSEASVQNSLAPAPQSNHSGSPVGTAAIGRQR